MTDANGSYCIRVKRDARVRLIADGIGLTSPPLILDTRNVVSDCTVGDCADVADLVIDPAGRTACISGTVYSEIGLPPFPPAVIFTDEFTWTQTDAGGNYCIPVRPDKEVRMVVIDPTSFLISGEAKETELAVTVPAGEARCGNDESECVETTIGTPLPPGAFVQCGQCANGTGMMMPVLVVGFYGMKRREKRTHRRKSRKCTRKSYQR